MSVAVERVTNAEALPPAWDSLAETPFQRQTFLAHAQLFNPCRQRYYFLTRQGELTAAAVVYTLTLDLFSHLAIPSPLKMHVIGIPCSVSSSGLFGIAADSRELLQHITRYEKGLLICLNVDAVPEGISLATGPTLPTMLFENRFACWDAYKASLRSSYRRRLRHQEEATASWQITTGSCAEYSKAMHQLYQQVYQQSRAKLEYLSAPFFRHLSKEFQLTSYSCHGHLCGWTISLHDRDHWYFFLGGRDYRVNNPPDLYFGMLLTVFKQAIAAGAQFIDFGQTAEIPKMRLGCIPQQKYMLGYHSNSLIRPLLYWGEGLLSYSRVLRPVHLFKGGG